MTKIMKCSCNHAFQDDTYGEGMRVFNAIAKEKSFRCSICSREVTKGEDSEKKGKKK